MEEAPPLSPLPRLQQPENLVFGVGAAQQFVEELLERPERRLLVVTSSPIRVHVDPLVDVLRSRSMDVTVFDEIEAEPDIALFERVRARAAAAGIDSVAGIGGGSALDTAKLVAALHGTDLRAADVFGIGNVPGRATYCACLPTTAGTGSEVSPNSILLDPDEQLKKGVVSPYLVADAAYVDPLLTCTVPPGLTASTGLDALTHCVEEYANKFAHPVVDLYALEGIRCIGRALVRACENGDDLKARTDMALGSLFGGLGLGPVNTGAVHALAYPLGGTYHVPHGISNAVLLPYVMMFNLEAAPARYARIAETLGVESGRDDPETARRGVERVRELTAACGVTQGLRDFGVPEEDLPRMAASAFKVQRLLKNNLREVTEADALAIYREAY
jgi:alcohol dehydrogenase class IV